MTTPISTSSRFPRVYIFGATLVVGYTFGLLISHGSSLQTRWQIAACASLFILGAALFMLPRLKSTLFYLLLFFLPVDVGKSFFYPPDPTIGIRPEVRINIPILLFLALAVLISAKVVIRRQPFLFFPKTTIPALLFISLSGLSIVKSPMVALSLYELLRMVIGFLIYFLIANYIVSERPPIAWVIGVLMASLIVQAGIGILQHYYEGTLGLNFFGEMELNPAQWGQQEISRACGLMGHPNALGALILLLVPIAGLTALFTTEWKLRCWALLATGLSVVALIITYSRSAWAGFILGTCLVAPIGCRRLFRSVSPAQKRRVLAAGGGLLLASIICVAFFASSIQRRLQVDDYGSAESRIPMMVDALQVIQQNYVLGVGLNNYSGVVLKYNVTGIHRQWQATVVHNIYLLMAAETGVMSLLLFLLFVFRVLLRTGSSINPSNAIEGSVLVLGAKVGITSFLILSLADPAWRFYPALQWTFWFLAALIVAHSPLNRHALSSAQA